MSILFVDGFDHYATGDLLKKWDAVEHHWQGGHSIQGWGSGRRGTGQCLAMDGGMVYHYFDEEKQTVITGCGFKLSATTAGLKIGLQWGGYYNRHCQVYFNGSNGVIYAYNDDGELGHTEEINLFTPGLWYFAEVYFYIHTDNGIIRVYLNGELKLEFTNARTRDWPSTSQYANTIKFEGTGTYYNTYIDDVYVLDGEGVKNNDVLGDVGVYTLWPDGAGSYTQFAPYPSAPNYENVDDLNDIDDDETYNQSNTIGVRDTYAMEALDISSTEIFGVAQNSCMRKQEAGIRHAKQILMVGSTIDEGEELLISDTYKVYQRILEYNPDDDEDWEDADVAGTQSGVEVA